MPFARTKSAFFGLRHTECAYYFGPIPSFGIAWIVLTIRDVRCTLAQAPLYFIGAMFVNFLWRGKLMRAAQWKEGEGAVVVANHTSSVDPFFVQKACDRVVHWMIAREFVEHSIWGPMVKIWKVIPANRGGVDTAATREAIRLCENGGLVGIFPEGRINMTEEFMLNFRPGAAMIAARANVPIVPIYIEGAPFDRFPHTPFLMPAQVRIYVGTPIRVEDCGDPKKSETLAKAMRMALEQIATMAGEELFRPSMAGRNWKPTREETLQVMEESVRRKRREAKPI